MPHPDRRLAIWLLLTILAGTSTGANADTPPAPASSLDQLAWLAGCWERVDGDQHLEEHWLRPLGGTMLGVSRTVVGNRTTAYEFMKIREEGGQIVYVAQPSGQPEATFAAVAIEPDSVVFENLEHDFPQRIIYRREPEGGLWARIEGLRDGAPRGVDFRLTRVACPEG